MKMINTQKTLNHIGLTGSLYGMGKLNHEHTRQPTGAIIQIPHQRPDPLPATCKLALQVACRAMTTEMTPERWQDRWEYFTNEPQQVSAIWTLYDAIQQVDDGSILSEEAPWALKFSEPSPLPAFTNPLDVIYYSQLDNYTDPNGTCYSSACAMMLKYLKPNSIKNDDAYLARVLSFGPSTDPNSQIKALASYDVEAKFMTTLDKNELMDCIDQGIPLPCGFLHHGTPQNPTGGGHWLTVIGYTATAVIVNDPYGEMNVANGTYGSVNGKCLSYSDKNWLPRWEADGPGTGWSIVATSW